jgi:putative peptidoglycan lipid II flippase
VTRQFILLASLRSLKLGLTVAVLLVYARLFGIGITMDAWIFASGTAAAVLMALWGPVNEIVRSRFVRQVAGHGEPHARASAASLLVFTTLASLVLCGGLALCAPWIVDTLYAAAEASRAQDLVVGLFLVMLPSVAIGQVLGLATAYMNCYDVIYAPEFMGIAASGINLACVLVLSPALGIYALAFGYYLGAAFSLAVVLRFLWKKGFFGSFGGWPAVALDARAIVTFALPLYFTFGAGQLNGVLEKYLASLMGVGVISSVNYASQIKATLQAVLTSVLFSLIVPRLTNAAAQPGAPDFRPMFRSAQRMGMAFLGVVLPFIFGTAEGLAVALFGDALSAPSGVQDMALLIRLYVVALVAVVLYLVYGVALLAQQQGRVYAALGVLAQGVSALICVLLFRSVGAAVFPLALAVSHLLAALLMLWRVDVDRRLPLFAECGLHLGGLAVACAVVLLAYRMVTGVVPATWWALLIVGLGHGLALLGAFALVRLFKLRHSA